MPHHIAYMSELIPNSNNPEHLPKPEDQVRSKIEEVARQYSLSPSNHWEAKLVPEYNKAFLAMLDTYMHSSGLALTDEDEILVLDFGSGRSTYYDAYKAFFEKFGRVGNKERRLGLISWDSDPDMRMAPGDATLCEMSVHLNEETRDKARGIIEDVLSERNKSKLDAVTMFAMGPGSYITEQNDVDKSYVTAISLLSEILSDKGVIIITTSFGGASKDAIISALQRAGFEIKVDEPNAFCQELLERNSGFTHEDIIIAAKT